MRMWSQRSETLLNLFFYFSLKIGSSRALLLYTSDSSTTSPSNNLISIQVDSITLNKIIASSEALGEVVKKINFRDVNGFVNLVKGKSSKFSYVEDDERAVCDASCDVRCKQTPVTTATPPRPFISKKDAFTAGPTYLPPITNKANVQLKDEAITPRQTSQYLPTTIRFASIRTTTEQPKQETTTSTTQRPIVQSTTRQTERPRQQPSTTRPSIARISTTQRTTSKPRSTPGPAYLPVAKKATVRSVTATERSYPPATWPSTSRLYTQTFPTWVPPVRRSTEAHIATSTAKYLYAAPSNSLIYAGEADE